MFIIDSSKLLWRFRLFVGDVGWPQVTTRRREKEQEDSIQNSRRGER
jgi:hypothetical protein